MFISNQKIERHHTYRNQTPCVFPMSEWPGLFYYFTPSLKNLLFLNYLFIYFYNCLCPFFLFLMPMHIVKNTVTCLVIFFPSEQTLLCICNLFCLYEQNLKLLHSLSHGKLVIKAYSLHPGDASLYNVLDERLWN